MIEEFVEFFGFLINHRLKAIVLTGCLIFAATTLIHILLKISFIKLRRFLVKRQNTGVWFYCFARILKHFEILSYYYIWIRAIAFVLESVLEHMSSSFIRFIDISEEVLISLLVMKTLFKSISLLEFDLINLSPKSASFVLTRDRVDAIAKLLKIIILITGAVVLMKSLGLNINGLITFGGIGGLALGFASKDLLSNFFGAMLVYFDRPFVIGETIKLDKCPEGIVEKIDWRITTIRTLEKKLFFIPNSLFSITSIENVSRISHRQFTIDLKILYKNLEEIKSLIEAIVILLESIDYVDEAESINVSISENYNEVVTIRISCYVTIINSSAFQVAKNDLILSIVQKIHEKNLMLADPILDH